jgi:ribose-phosphate pyrophosphokinase
MNVPLVIPLPGNDALASRIAPGLGGELGHLETRWFPDGETYLRFEADPRGRDLVLVCTLDQPDPKILPLLFTAATGRDLGARRIGLVAPYLSYMRQDRRFHDGEAVTSAYFARLLSSAFDWLVTVDPHLHRHRSLDEIYSIPSRVAHSAPLIADWIAANERMPFIVGPDIESEQWVAGVATRAGAPYRVLRKERRGDRDVEITIPDLHEFRERRPVLVDDIVSSGRTMIETARQLRTQGLQAPVCIAVHALFSAETHQSLRGLASRIISTNAVPHETNGIDLSRLLVDQASALLGVQE